MKQKTEYQNSKTLMWVGSGGAYLLSQDWFTEDLFPQTQTRPINLPWNARTGTIFHYRKLHGLWSDLASQFSELENKIPSAWPAQFPMQLSALSYSKGWRGWEGQSLTAAEVSAGVSTLSVHICKKLTLGHRLLLPKYKAALCGVFTRELIPHVMLCP